MEQELHSTPSFAYGLTRAMYKAMSVPEKKVARTIEFQQFLRRLKKCADNILGRGSVNNGIPASSQRLYPDYDEEIWNMWNYFTDRGLRETEIEERIMDLYSRKKMYDISELNVGVFLNYNSRFMFRDTNISISLVDPNGTEIGMVGVFILKEGIVEIFQLQCKKKYGAGPSHFHALLDATKDYFRESGFLKLRIIRSTRLFSTNTPTHIPAGVQGDAKVHEWLGEHQLHMKLTYDVNPVRKWGFHKPKDRKIAQDYSGEMDL